jgi:hypothetical protein
VGEVVPGQNIPVKLPFKPGVHLTPGVGIPVRYQPPSNASFGYAHSPEAEHEFLRAGRMARRGDWVGTSKERWHPRQHHPCMRRVATGVEVEADRAVAIGPLVVKAAGPVTDERSKVVGPALDSDRRSGRWRRGRPACRKPVHQPYCQEAEKRVLYDIAHGMSLMNSLLPGDNLRMTADITWSPDPLRSARQTPARVPHI